MDVIQNVIAGISCLDLEVMEKTQQRLDGLTKPQGSLGRLEELAKQICGITGQENPRLRDKVIFTLAADHGVVAEGVSAYPQEVTAQMVYNFLSGGAGINVLAAHSGARVVVVDVGVAVDLKPHLGLKVKKINYGTKNMSTGPAMTRDEAVRSVGCGMEIFEDELKRGVDAAGTGEMGIGNTTSASAIAAVFTGKPVRDLTGRGTGLDDKALKKKINVIKRSLDINRPDASDPIDVLSKVGGFEIGALTGIILAAAFRKKPVVIDGFISGAAALLAFHLQPKIKEYLIAAHNSVESGHGIILKHMGLKPLLDLELRLGEGTGAALGLGLLEASVKILTQMATFKNAHVSERTDD